MDRGDLSEVAEVLGPLTADRPALRATELAARAERRMAEGAEGAASDLAGRALEHANGDDGYWRARARLDQRWRAEEDLAEATELWLGKRRELLQAEAALLEAAEVSGAGAEFVLRMVSEDPGAASPLETEEEKAERASSKPA